MMAHSLGRMNPPCRVIFAGFDSDTFTLGRQGWDIAFEEMANDFGYSRKMILLLKHRSGLTGWAESLESFSPYDWRMDGQRERYLPIFEVKQMSSKMLIRTTIGGIDFSRFRLADTDPSVMSVTEIDLAALPIFMAKNQPAKEDLIVDPATVSELLAQIRERQSPEQKEIRDRARRREIVPVQHASIYTLPLAA